MMLVCASFSSAAAAQENGDRAFIMDLELLRASKAVKLSEPPALSLQVDESVALEVDLASVKTEEELDRYQVLGRSLSTRYYNQYLDSARHRANSELRFIHQVVSLKRSEFEKLEPALRLEAKRCLFGYCQNLAVRRYERAAGWKNSQNSPRLELEAIEVAALRWAEQHLEKDQLERYRWEIEQRHVFRKESVLELLVVKCDERFSFSQSQRKQTLELLRKHWDDDWVNMTSVALTAGIGAVPGIPFKELGSVLNADQAIILASLNTNRPKSIPIPISRKKPKVSLVDELEFAPESEAKP